MWNKRWTLVMTVLVVGAMLLSACTQTAASTADNVSTSNRSITVVGQGKASGTPDVAHINIGVETAGISAQEAMDANKVQMTALLEKIKDMGVADKDIQTSNFSIFTERREPKSPGLGETGGEEIIYRVSNQVNVTVRDIAKLGDLLDQAVSVGANNIYGVNLEVLIPASWKPKPVKRPSLMPGRARRAWPS